jgi:hypothetical protein
MRMYERLTDAGVFARLLKVEVGYRSHLMDPSSTSSVRRWPICGRRNHPCRCTDRDWRSCYRPEWDAGLLVPERARTSAVRGYGHQPHRGRSSCIPRSWPKPGAKWKHSRDTGAR